MAHIESLFHWLGTNFDADLYLLASKVQAIIWSAADIALVLAVLKIADLARKEEGLGKLRIPYWALWTSALMTPLLLLAVKSRQFFLLECAICGSQFCILLYVVLTERKRILDLVIQVRKARL